MISLPTRGGILLVGEDYLREALHLPATTSIANARPDFDRHGTFQFVVHDCELPIVAPGQRYRLVDGLYEQRIVVAKGDVAQETVRNAEFVRWLVRDG